MTDIKQFAKEIQNEIGKKVKISKVNSGSCIYQTLDNQIKIKVYRDSGIKEIINQ